MIRTDEMGNQFDENDFLIYKEDDCDFYLPEMESAVKKIKEDSEVTALKAQITSHFFQQINSQLSQNNIDAAPHWEEARKADARLRVLLKESCN